jgi:hypothetical protein
MAVLGLTQLFHGAEKLDYTEPKAEWRSVSPGAIQFLLKGCCCFCELTFGEERRQIRLLSLSRR